MLRLSTFLIALLPLFIFGQESYYQKLESADGLTTNNIYFCFQDSDGFMWFGTDLGASRFDGYEFENFDHEDGLFGNEIFQIFEDSKKRIWFLSLNGEMTYFKDGQFHNSSNTPFLADMKSSSMYSSFYEHTNGDIYISTNSAMIFRIDATNHVTQIKSARRLYKIWGTSDGVFVLASNGVHQIFNDKLRMIKSIDLEATYARPILHNNTLFYGYGDKIFSYAHYGDANLVATLPEKTDITWLQSIDDRRLFVGTRNGLFTYDLVKRKGFLEKALSSDIVTCTLVDREGNLWISSLGNGIYFSPNPETKIYQSGTHFPVDNITTIERGFDNSLWVGGASGYYGIISSEGIDNFWVVNNNNQPLTTIRRSSDGTMLVASKSILTFVQGEKVISFYHLANDALIVGDYVYIAATEVVKIKRSEYFGLPVNSSQNKYVLGPILKKYSILDKNTQVLCEGKNNEVYFGTQQGLFSEKNGRITDLGKLDDRLASPINDIIYDPVTKFLYVATNSRGLVVLKDNRIVYCLNTKNGLSSNNCQSLLLDSEQNLWIGTSTSLDLVRANSKRDKVINFGATISRNLMRVTDIERIGDDLFIATNEGLISYPLNFSATAPAKIKLSIRSFSVNEQPVSWKKGGISLEHNENSITIDVIGISFKDMGKLTYAYQLVGSQEGWRTTKNRTITFEALPPGDYTFRIKAISISGEQSEVISLSFSIAQPFWRTIWFISLVVLAIAGIIVFLWRRRIHRERMKFELERKFVESELEKLELEKAYLIAEQKAGILQMNPHFLFNSLNTIKGFYAREKFNEANRFISKFSKLLRNILECNTQFITLEREIEILTLYLELMQMRYEDHFEFEIINSINDPGKVLFPPMMLQPLAENAVIHGIADLPNGKLIVSFDLNDSGITCKVTDNGVGFSKATGSLHQSMGISNIQDRLELLSQQFGEKFEFNITSPIYAGMNGGTEVRITVPLKYEADESNNN